MSKFELEMPNLINFKKLTTKYSKFSLLMAFLLNLGTLPLLLSAVIPFDSCFVALVPLNCLKLLENVKIK
jgi:hypothetical protein